MVFAATDGPGAATRSPADGLVVNGRPVTLTAKPARDALFVDWTGGGETFHTAAIKAAPAWDTLYTARFRLKAECEPPSIAPAALPENRMARGISWFPGPKNTALQNP